LEEELMKEKAKHQRMMSKRRKDTQDLQQEVLYILCTIHVCTQYGTCVYTVRYMCVHSMVHVFRLCCNKQI